MTSFVLGRSVYVAKVGSFEVKYIYVVLDSASARVVKYTSVKGIPRIESEEILSKADSGTFANKSAHVQMFEGDNARIQYEADGKSFSLEETKFSEFNSISNRAIYYPKRTATIKMLKCVLGFGVDAAIYYDRKAQEYGIWKKMLSNTSEFELDLKVFHHSIMDSVLDRF
ncbi:MAG: hypothetical protein JWO30_4676 [Fibrobacteres bacterium]|nr:hypothetical protein [Fibrobacterota bacterium]